MDKKEKEIIIECARKYNVSSIFAFGSSAGKKRSGFDIDLAIRGIKPAEFFNFYAELFKYLSRPVDLVDLDKADNYFTQRILEEGEVIYEAKLRAA